MTEQQDLRAQSPDFLEEEDLGYQAVPLPGGVVTPGHDREYLLDSLFGDDFTGQSFCDIGSYLGFFCLEALRRGASSATGIDADISNVRQARKIAELWSVEPEYIHRDVEEWDPGERTYDVVACLNVMHHLYDPIHLLRTMMKMARSRLVLEVCVPTWRDVLRARFLPSRPLGIGAPTIFLRKPKRHYLDAAGRTFMFTPRALRVLFNGHTTMFEPIGVVRSPFKDRIVVTARKRRIGHLVIVAGPTSSGKSTLASQIASDPAFRRQFGMGPEEWPVVQASKVSELAAVRHDRLILHYDFMRPALSGIRAYNRDPVLHLSSVAERVTIITIATPRERLKAQLRSGEIDAKGSRAAKRHLDLLDRYEKPRFLSDWYGAWEEFCAALPGAERVLVENQGEFRLASGEHWAEILDA